MKTQTAASITSIPPRPRTAVALYDDNVSITATFRPGDPIGSTEVVPSLDSLDATAYLNLLDSTIARLIAYRDGYRQAMDMDADADADADPTPVRAPLPLPLPARWYAW